VQIPTFNELNEDFKFLKCHDRLRTSKPQVTSTRCFYTSCVCHVDFSTL